MGGLKWFKMCCCPPCWPQNIIEGFAFQPPTPMYTVCKAGAGYELKIGDSPVRGGTFHYALTATGTKIACVYYGVRSPPTDTTILYSHCNAEDLRHVMPSCVWLAKSLHCNILAYDYSGYGRSSGRPSERQMYADAQAAYQLLVDKYGRSPEDIILHGHSLGSAPTVDLASRLRVKGVVIQSGFVSALNVKFHPPRPRSLRCDAFKNIDKVAKVSSPTLVIHGTEDHNIDVRHGVMLYERCPASVTPLWVRGGGHGDLEFRPEFLSRLKQFINEVS